MAGYYADKQVVPLTPLPHDKKSQFSDLEVGHAPYSQLPEVAPTPPTLPQHDTDKIVTHSRQRIAFGRGGFYVSKPKFWLGLVVVILIIIAAVVGTAVGVLKHNEHSHSTSPPPGSSNDSNDSPSQSSLVWNQSALAVTGWTYDNNEKYSIRLFYQDAEGYLRLSLMESIAEEAWTAGTRFVKAMQGTPLAASCHNQSIYNASKTAMETHVFYLDDNSALQEFVFTDNDQTGHSGDLNAKNITPAHDTRLASYWPSVVYQNSDNTISEMRYNCTNGNTNCWNVNDLNIKGSGPSAALAEVPMRRNVSGLFLYYQREDKELVNMAWGNDTGQWSTAEFAQPIPQSHPAAVLATPRTADGPFLNFVALYQDDNDRDISYAWKNVRGWDPPTKDPSLSGANNGTSIACLTPESWWDKDLVFGGDLSRCFFVGAKGRLRQAQWAGKAWKDLGFIRAVETGG